jgi:hypothetical protein
MQSLSIRTCYYCIVFVYPTTDSYIVTRHNHITLHRFLIRDWKILSSMSKRDLDKILRTNKQRGNTRCPAEVVCVPVGDTVWEHHAYR